MAKKDRPWWGNNDTLTGGETFKYMETKRKLGVKSGDVFRVEKTARGSVTLIPHPNNVGTWNQTHDKTNPVKLTEVGIKNDAVVERAFSMKVTIKTGATPAELFLVERKSGAISIKKTLKSGPGQDDSSASVER